MESKVAVLGNADFVMPFTALGLDTFASGEGSTEVVDRAKEIIDGQYGLVIVAENVAPAAEEVFSSVQKLAVPCVVVVPFTTESQGFATKSLGHALKMATGIDIFSD